MASIVSYQKFIDSDRTVEIALPEDEETHQKIGTELATIDGVTYVSIPDDLILPKQPKEIKVIVVTLSQSIKDAIYACSPHIALINNQVKSQIAEKYSIEDEIKLLRTQPSAAFTAYNSTVEAIRALGKAKKAALGL